MNEFVIKQVTTDEQPEEVPDDEGENKKMCNDLDSREDETQIGSNSDNESAGTDITNSPDRSFEGFTAKNPEPSQTLCHEESEDSETWAKKLPLLPLFSPLETENDIGNGENE